MSDDYLLRSLDDTELERLRDQHDVWKVETDDVLARSGFGRGQHLADLGCGPGFLSFDLAELVGGKAPRPEVDVDQFEAHTMSGIGLIPEIVPRYRSTYFSHIFSGGYSAGYYVYIWAEQLDADAFEAFKEKGLFDRATAQSFRQNILEPYGTLDLMTQYKVFRGAEPRIEPLLKRRGLISSQP